MTKKNFFVFISFIMPMIMLGQYAENIRTGRPGQSIGAFTVGEDVFQVQSGVTYTNFQDALGGPDDTYEFSNVFRLGIWEKFELSGVVRYRSEEFAFPTRNRISGVSSTQIGARYNITGRRGALPAIGIQGRLLLRLQQEEFRRANLGTQLALAAGNRITDWMSYGTNLALLWPGNGTGPVELYTFALGFSLTDRISSMVEVYGRLEDFTTNYNAGLGYLVTSDFKVDVSAGVNGSNTREYWFVDAGASFRFDWRD